MNTLKLLVTAISFLTLNSNANELTPSKTYTSMKNSNYISALEKKRNSNVDERAKREDVREYMRYQRDLAK